VSPGKMFSTDMNMYLIPTKECRHYNEGHSALVNKADSALRKAIPRPLPLPYVTQVLGLQAVSVIL
jgi:hypothetical protein